MENGDIVWDGVALDVTDRKRAQEERTALLEQLHQAQKLEAIGTLAGGIAHDFNNILTSILGNASLAQRDLPDGDAARMKIDEVLQAGQRAQELIQQILTFSRKQETVAAPVRVDLVVDEALKMLHGTLPDSVDIQSRIQADAPSALADATQIHQVIMNLCVNASQAIGVAKGRLTVTLDELRIDLGFRAGLSASPNRSSGHSVTVQELGPGRTKMWLGHLDPGDYLRITVRDTGGGMDAATLVRIFEPFYTTKGNGHGTGLGLATVRGIVLNHRGAIVVESELDSGSSFEIYLPCIDAETEAP